MIHDSSIVERRPRISKRLFCNVFLLLAAAACSTLGGPGPEPGGFDLRGKLGVVQGGESFSARFLWRQQGSRFTIDLWGPLGQGRVQLAGDPGELELRDGDGSVISRGAPETIMQRHLGWTLPLGVLPEWVRGRPAPGLPVGAPERDAQGRWNAFEQLGWQVALERYAEPSKPADGTGSAAVPYRVTVRRDGCRVRLAISEWRI